MEIFTVPFFYFLEILIFREIIIRFFLEIFYFGKKDHQLRWSRSSVHSSHKLYFFKSSIWLLVQIFGILPLISLSYLFHHIPKSHILSASSISQLEIDFVTFKLFYKFFFEGSFPFDRSLHFSFVLCSPRQLLGQINKQ